jgi:hypothetical protein
MQIATVYSRKSWKRISAGIVEQSVQLRALCHVSSTQTKAHPMAWYVDNHVSAWEWCRDADYARPLTEDEQLERDTLIAENPFKDWMRRDFNAFIRACEKHGRENLSAVAKEVDSKSEDEVRAYAATFFKRYTELQDYERYMKQIERGEQKIQRQQDIMKVLPNLQFWSLKCCTSLEYCHCDHSACHADL